MLYFLSLQDNVFIGYFCRQAVVSFLLPSHWEYWKGNIQHPILILSKNFFLNLSNSCLRWASQQLTKRELLLNSKDQYYKLFSSLHWRPLKFWCIKLSRIKLPSTEKPSVLAKKCYKIGPFRDCWHTGQDDWKWEVLLICWDKYYKTSFTITDSSIFMQDEFTP